MLELLLCSLLTILPDYLFRRYGQGKRLGKEITLYSVWFELRWGITACLMLTVGLITVIFYNHPSTSNATLLYRTVPIVPETNGRVAEIYVDISDEVKEGAPIFRLDSSKQEAAIETARRKIAEVEAAAGGRAIGCRGGRGQDRGGQGLIPAGGGRTGDEAGDPRRNPGAVAVRDIERAAVAVEARKGGIAAATAAKDGAEARVSTLLPAEKASAEAELAQAEVDLDKTTIRAGVSGRVEQFALRVGDIVNPFLRPAGRPDPGRSGTQCHYRGLRADRGAGHEARNGGRGDLHLEALDGDPDGGDHVQDFIAAGQFRGGEQLIDPQQVLQPGTILVFLEPLYEGGLEGVTPGSSCIANAYTSNHELIASGQVTGVKSFALHAVDAVGLVHAMILRIQALVLPIQTLVFGGH